MPTSSVVEHNRVPRIVIDGLIYNLAIMIAVRRTIFVAAVPQWAVLDPWVD
jgi:hypothetical protein